MIADRHLHSRVGARLSLLHSERIKRKWRRAPANRSAGVLRRPGSSPIAGVERRFLTIKSAVLTRNQVTPVVVVYGIGAERSLGFDGSAIPVVLLLLVVITELALPLRCHSTLCLQHLVLVWLLPLLEALGRIVSLQADGRIWPATIVFAHRLVPRGTARAAFNFRVSAPVYRKRVATGGPHMRSRTSRKDFPTLGQIVYRPFNLFYLGEECSRRFGRDGRSIF